MTKLDLLDIIFVVVGVTLMSQAAKIEDVILRIPLAVVACVFIRIIPLYQKDL